MRLTNPDFCGLLVWGTKRGLQPFFHFGVDIDEHELERMHGDNDIRNHNINPAEPYGRTFYGIDQYNGTTLLHQFRTILDRVNRPGFYAVTLAIPAGKGLPAGTSLQLLNRLSGLYYQLYIQGSSATNQISVEGTEDPTAFGEVLRSPEFKLIPLSGDTPRSSIPKQAFSYSSLAELSAIFDQQGREEIRSVKKLFLFSDSMRSICPTDILLGILPPAPMRYELELQVSGADDIAFQQVTVTASRNGTSVPVSGHSGGRLVITGIREKDEVQVNISQQGYVTRTITPMEVQQWLLAQGGDNAQPVKKKVVLQKAAAPLPGGSPKGSRTATNTEGFDFGERSTGRKGKEEGENRKLWIITGSVIVLIATGVFLYILNTSKPSDTGVRIGPEPEVVNKNSNSAGGTQGSGAENNPERKIGNSQNNDESLRKEYERILTAFSSVRGKRANRYARVADEIEALKKQIPKNNGTTHPVRKSCDSLIAKITELTKQQSPKNKTNPSPGKKGPGKKKPHKPKGVES